VGGGVLVASGIKGYLLLSTHARRGMNDIGAALVRDVVRETAVSFQTNQNCKIPGNQ